MKDFEVANDGRITKVNNWNSEKKVFCINGFSVNLFFYNNEHGQSFIDLGLLYATEEARDRAKFKMEIETKLKNIAERLNNGKKIDWEDISQNKFNIYYNYDDNIIDFYFSSYCGFQGTICCLDKDFLEVAKKEIGEENLIKYFKRE